MHTLINDSRPETLQMMMLLARTPPTTVQCRGQLELDRAELPLLVSLRCGGLGSAAHDRDETH
jgi:hypothetical protein